MIEAQVTKAADALRAEVDRRDEWYGLDNWSCEEVARFVLKAAEPIEVWGYTLEELRDIVDFALTHDYGV